MKSIPTLKFLFKRLGLFVFVFLALSLLSSVDLIKKGHNQIYCGITNVVFNVINPEIYARFSTETRTDIMHFGIGISLYEIDQYSKSELQRIKSGRIPSNIIKFPDLHTLVFIPILLLISLFAATPMSIKTKLIKIFSGILIFYLILVFYYSYIFSLTLNNGQFELDSLWHYFIFPFGVDNAELINIFVIMIWLGLSIPQLINLHSLK